MARTVGDDAEEVVQAVMEEASGKGPDVDCLGGAGGEVEPALGWDRVAVGVERDELLLRRCLDVVLGRRVWPKVALVGVQEGGDGGSGAAVRRAAVADPALDGLDIDLDSFGKIAGAHSGGGQG